ncbi:MAG: GTPase [Bacillota bacterium]
MGRNKCCPGCGAAYQCADPARAGYVRPGMGRKNGGLICQRCFQLIHYGKTGESSLTPGEAGDLTRKALADAAFSIWVADFADLTGTLTPGWSEWLNYAPAVLVVNKIDLLPIPIPAREMEGKVRGLTRDFPRRPQHFLAVSALKRKGLTELQSLLNAKVPPGGKAVFFGATNTGKSSLVNSVLHLNKVSRAITVSPCRGTTQNVLEQTVASRGWKLVDTPGLTPGGGLGEFLCPACSTALRTGKKMQGKLAHLKSGQSAALSGIAGFTLVGGGRTFLFYTSEKVRLHFTNSARLAQLMNAQWKGLMDFPCGACRSGLPEREEREVTVPEGHDLAWSGLGWISVRGGDAALRIFHPPGLRYEIRSALIGKSRE